jgi:hypothetical protein
LPVNARKSMPFLPQPLQSEAAEHDPQEPAVVGLNHLGQPPVRKGYASRFLLAVCATMVALMLSEVGLRLLAGSRLWVRCGRPFYLTIYGPYAGWRGVPKWPRLGRRSHCFTQFNSQGFHDREHNKEKPVGTLRIAVLGDSMTEAAQVPLDQTFCSVLEAS